MLAQILSQPMMRALVVFLMAVAALTFSSVLKPTEYAAAQNLKIQLAEQVPTSFQDWREDKSITPVLPSEDVTAKLDVLYSDTLARTYINSNGDRIMLSIAYGSDQHSEVTQVHRPEFCYSSQGFKVSRVGIATLPIGDHGLEVQRLTAVRGPRYEPISYWITLGETVTLPGFGRKLKQIKFGLQGEIPDGMLVRVSSLSSEGNAAFQLQQSFLKSLYENMNPSIRNRYFGA